MKTTIVLLPGLNGTDGLFNPLMKCLQGHFDVVAINYPTDEKLSYQQLVEFIRGKLVSVTGKYIVLGESFSGPLSLFVADKKPDGLIGVVLVATFITAPNLKVGRYLPWTIGFSLARPLYGMRMALSKKENRSLVAAISTELQKVSARVLSSRIEETYTVDATESLRNCQVPIVYFRGIYDYVVPKRNVREILAIRSDINVIEFKAQHFLLQSKSEQACSEIRKFAEFCVSCNRQPDTTHRR